MKVVIVRGISGSGKTTWLKRVYPEARVCSADHFFVAKDGSYQFDVEKLDEAHNFCLKKFLGLIANETPLVAVDNTNLTRHEVAPYYQLAKAFGYEIELVYIFCPPEVAAVRNVHGVPSEKVRLQYCNYEPGIPRWGEITGMA